MTRYIRQRAKRLRREALGMNKHIFLFTIIMREAHIYAHLNVEVSKRYFAKAYISARVMRCARYICNTAQSALGVEAGDVSSRPTLGHISSVHACPTANTQYRYY